MMKLVTKPTPMKPTIDATLLRLELGELFAAVPADRQEQIDREALVNHIRKLEFHLEDRHQKPQIEKQQQRLEQVVREIVPELLEDRHSGPFVGLLLAVERDLGRHECVVDGDALPFLEVS